MLKYEVTEDELTVEFDGTARSLTVDIGFLIREVYRELSKQEPMVGELFRHLVTKCINDPNAPTWRKEEEC